jgi:hypothetical protein
MGKRAKGLDLVRQQNAVKKSMLVSCKKHAEQLEAENYALKNDPKTVVGQFIGQFREMYSQNSRLSVLAAALIKKLGDNVVMTKGELEAYQDKRINIKWEVPDGQDVTTATEFTFAYELQDAPKQTPVQPATEFVECTDPNCNLPKDLKHTHEVPLVVPGESPVTLSTDAPVREPVKPGDTMVVNGEEVTVTAVGSTRDESEYPALKT